MAFETIRGEAGVDFIGTDGVDVLFSINETGAVTVDAKDGDDDIRLASANGVVGTVTVQGGAGDDTIRATDDVAADASARFSNADIKGGAGDDTINSTGAVSSVLRGNEGEDDFRLNGNYTNSTVNGNSGADSFTAAAAGVTLSNTKILGGSDNDGAMNFTTAGGLVVVDSTINGSKGVDNITIGRVTSAVNFTVFGGQGNDVITSTNAAADTVVYSGDKGDDSITANGGAQVSILGGEGDDVITSGTDEDTIDGGEGADSIDASGDDDTITGGAGNDTIVSGTGDDTINGGAGADTITVDGAEENVYQYGSVSDSAAALSGTTNTFDTLTGADFAAGEVLDLTAVATQLIGDSVRNNNQVINGGAIAVVAADNVNNFAQLRTFINNGGGTNPSGANGVGAGRISIQLINVIDGAGEGSIAGDYILINNSNAIFDSGDMMFENDGAVITAAGIEAAIEAAF